MAPIRTDIDTEQGDLATSPRTPRIRFNDPAMEGAELEYIREALASGHSSSSGPFAARTSEFLRDTIGARDVLLTTSCTAALEMAGLLLDVRPGDVVIVPSFTFVTSALAFVRAGARLLFCDIEPETLGVDPASVAELLTPRTRAVVAVHYAGVGCDIEGLETVLSEAPGVDLIEDDAHGLFGRAGERVLGSIGRMSTLSFHETKNFICGEGGALVLNRAEDVARAHVLYDKGTDRRAFMLGQVDKYSWQDIGSSFGLSEILAAFLFAQLEQRDTILRKRRHVWDRYDSILRPVAREFGIQTPVIPPSRQQAYHMYYVLLPDRRTRDLALRRLDEMGIQATFHYVPLHSAPAASSYVVRSTSCPVSDDISGRMLRLPFHNNLADGTIDRVCDSLLHVLGT